MDLAPLGNQFSGARSILVSARLFHLSLHTILVLQHSNDHIFHSRNIASNMAVIKMPAETQFGTVVETTKSIDTCTASTLRLLKALLGFSDGSPDGSESASATKPTEQKRTKTVGPSRPVKNSTKRTDAKITILACPEVPSQPLPRNKRLALATDTFNRTLKNLGDALKAKQSHGYKKSTAERSPLKETQGRARAVSTISKPPAPDRYRQQRSPELLRDTGSCTPHFSESPCLIATAECARTSLRCLRQLKSEDAGNKELDTQLEQAALVLISKLQGLGLIVLAIEETLRLRKALDNALRSQPGGPRNGKKLYENTDFSSLADCIEFSGCEAYPKAFGLITSFQSQVLQLIAVQKRTLTDKDILQRLNPARSGTPCYMVLFGAERGWISPEKAAIQLHSLSQSVLSFCPLPATGASKLPLTHGSPEAQFQLQCLALQMRCHWWNFANHQSDIDKEIWIPFHRFMLLLRQRVGKTTRAHFLLVKESLDELLSLLSKTWHEPKSQISGIRPTPSVISALQAIAEATGSTEDALYLIQILDNSTTDLSGLQAALYHCKLATAILLGSGSSNEACISTLEKVLGVLDNPLKGTATELSELLLQAARLRKAAVSRLTAINENRKSTELEAQDRSYLSSACIRIIFGVLHMVVRYVDFKPRGGGVAGSPPTKYTQISQQSELVARHSVRNALAGVQLCLSHEPVGWERCMTALSDCLSVAEKLKEKSQDTSKTKSDTDGLSTAFVKVSNMYWSWYLKQKDMGACRSDLLRILRGSIEALEGRTSSEKKIGFLAIKCEKAAIMYMEAKQFQEARQVLATAIAAHIQAEVLSTATTRTFTESPRQIWGEADCPEFLLGRVLSGYARLLIKHQCDSSSAFFYDRPELKADERALLLERQFAALREISVPEDLHSRLKDVAQTVLSLYTEDSHPLHRLRFISNLLIFCSKCRLNFYKFLPEEVVNMFVGDSSNESTLSQKTASFPGNCLRASLLLQWKFQTSNPSEDLLQDFLQSHNNVIDSCKSWTSVLPFINEPPVVMAQVQSVIDFSDMRGLLQIKLDALLTMRRLLELQPEKDSSALASCTTQVGLQYTRLGLTNKAGRALATAETLLKQSTSKTLIALQWHLAYAEYLTALCSYDKAADQLVSAHWRYEADFLSEQEGGPPGSRLAQHKYLAQATYIASMLAFENGDGETAALYAKKSVKISIRQWTMLEKLLDVKSASTAVEKVGAKFDELVDDLSNLTLSAEDMQRKSSGKAAAFWAHTQMHFDNLLHLSRLSAHQGSFQDAVYYAEQAKKVGLATNSKVLVCRASALLAAHLAEGGRLDESRTLIDDHCMISWECMEDSTLSLQASMEIAGAHLVIGDSDRCSQYIKEAYKGAHEIHSKDHASAASESQNEDSVEARPIPKGKRSTGHNPSKARKRCDALSNDVNSAAHTTAKGLPVRQALPRTEVSTSLQRLQAQLHILQFRFCIESDSPDDARSLLQTVKHLAKSSVNDVWCHVLQATLMLDDALRLLQSDAVYSVLAESTIAYPTRCKKTDRELPQDDNAPRDPTTTAPAKCARQSRQSAKKQTSSQNELLRSRELMSKARELLLSVSSSSLSGCSSSVSNELSELLTRLQLLCSLLSTATSSNPLQITSHLTAPRSLCWSREVASINADAVLTTKSSVFEWPDMHAVQEAAPDFINFFFGHTDLQEQLIDALPSSWSVINIALSDDESEILISKIRRCQYPFLLRLPLHRTSEDFDEIPFEFHTAKIELLDIIKHANLTAHDAKASSDKQGKKSWWAAREDLDTRLESLLSNIENLWFGGFRGIFSDQNYNEGLLSRFSESLLRVLDQQLPSRRRAGANTEPRFQLHPHVLELFIALGNPDEGDLDDAITDLLYFVIDILQFQGERNAYDEIDFDAMVLEVIDALRSYHDAVKDTSSGRGGHKILILDKALHAFPWESLPCLEGQSVSRMPSLSCLQERLQQMRQNYPTSASLCINPQKGAYILNPSSDLKSTQQTFLGPFESALGNYTSIVNRAPSETEFEACLRDKELCLYFGHGSGGQYIRGRTIKRLKKCAVTFLMGCSSSKMVECGQFEPYGVPYNYLHAGSAAVIGTLWDVTDKDIDRFAMATFVNWGLLGQDVLKENKGKSRKLKNKGVTRKQNAELDDRHAEENPRTMVALDDAVARARDACLLRYLNGAAPVIYGIPVYLDEKPGSH